MTRWLLLNCLSLLKNEPLQVVSELEYEIFQRPAIFGTVSMILVIIIVVIGVVLLRQSLLRWQRF